MSLPLRIGVAGAGIGGLAAAALLAHGGHRVEIFDQFDAPRPVGSGLIIQPVGLEVLAACGAAAAALAHGNRIHRMEGVETAQGLKVLDVSYARRGEDRFGLAIHRASLFAALLDAALESGVTLRPNARVVATEADRQGTLVLESGEQAGPFDLVVDATGARSPLSPLRAKPLSYGAIWGTVPWPDTGLTPDRLTQRYFRAERMAGILPIGRLPGADTPLAAFFWSLPAASYDAWRARPLEAWKGDVLALWPEAEPFLTHIRSHDDMTMARYGHGTLKRPWARRLAILGDAAHRASPQLGQGANMALLDAAALAQALHTHGPEDAPAEYARLRRWHVRLYQAMSWVFTPQYQSGSRVLPVLRDRVLMPVSRVPPVPAMLTKLVCGDLIPPLRGTPRQQASSDTPLQLDT